MDELNPKLYAALERRFGKVLISNPGERLVERKIPDPVRPGRYKQLILRSGEYYRVDCPYCGDKKGRLYINCSVVPYLRNEGRGPKCLRHS